MNKALYTRLVVHVRMGWLVLFSFQLFLVCRVETVDCEKKWSNIWTNYKDISQCFIKNTKPVQPKPSPVELDPLNITYHFIEQGYDHTRVPQDLEDFEVIILHEGLFTFQADSHGDFDALSTGPFNDVYLVSYNKTENVIIKIAKEATLESVTESAMIMSYLQNTVPIPKLLGLTRVRQSLELVQEYFPNSITLSSFLKDSNTTSSHLISITLQITRAVRQMHEKFTLFNDLTPRNILINFTNGQPVVKLADFSQATFKFGTEYVKPINPTVLSPYIAPELHVLGFTTPAVEVYSLGDILRRINMRLKSSILNRVSIMCKQEDPKKRPSAKVVQSLLEMLLGNLVTKDRKLLVKLVPQQPVLFLYDRPHMQLSIPLISHTNLYRLQNEKGKGIWLRHNKFLRVFAAELYSRYVIVKTVRVDFEFTRMEAVIHLIMNNTETVPNFHGLFPTGQKMSSFGLVSDLYGKGVSLEDILPSIPNLPFEFQAGIVIQICDIVQKFHDRGFLINNIGLDNFLIDDDNKKARIRIVGLNSVSGLDGLLPKIILDDLLNLKSTALDVKRERRTSIQSDSFSIGYAVMDLQLNNALKLQTLLLYKDCLDKGALYCPSILQVKETFITFLQSKAAPKDFS